MRIIINTVHDSLRLFGKDARETAKGQVDYFYDDSNYYYRGFVDL
jgi:hypothetical protein